jgi:hypothetical protein
MIAYILTREPYHDNSTVVGVFRTKEGAERVAGHTIGKVEWEKTPYFGGDARPTWQTCEEHDYEFWVIAQVEVIR